MSVLQALPGPELPRVSLCSCPGLWVDVSVCCGAVTLQKGSWAPAALHRTAGISTACSAGKPLTGILLVSLSVAWSLIALRMVILHLTGCSLTLSLPHLTQGLPQLHLGPHGLEMKDVHSLCGILGCLLENL